jgi:hypothetical protein|tara:strand:- start:111 stop:308 length:198 start_codon:yes stop_codon:yes gene_type:complete
MNKIKHINKNIISINGEFHRGYVLGDLPPTFSFLFKEELNEEGEKERTYGISKWLNYKGLTWIKI